MKRLLLLLPLVLFTFVSCSKEETPAPPPTPTYKLSFSAEEGGTVSTEGGIYNQGSKITVTATPDGQYLFKEWSDGSTVNPREITVNADLTLKATFVKKTYPLAVTVEGEGTVQEEVIIQGSTSETEYNAGTTVRLTATPNDGWVFAGWSGDVESEELEVEVPIEKGTAVSAIFKRDSFELNITIEGEGTVKEEVIVQPGQYDYETVVRLTAIPAEGYVFSGWSGDITSKENPIEVEVESEINLSIVFESLSKIIPFNISEYSPINRTSGTLQNSIVSPVKLMDGRDLDFLDTIYNNLNHLIFESSYQYLDFNQDGLTDLFAFRNIIGFGSEDGGYFYPGQLITVSDIHGKKEVVIQPTERRVQGLVEPNDFDGDGLLEMIVYGSEDHDLPPEYKLPLSYVDIMADGSMIEKYIGPKTSSHDLATGDIDNDGDADIFNPEWWLGKENGQLQRNRPLFYINDGNGNFSTRRDLMKFQDNFSLDQTSFIRLSSDFFDLDNDGYLDLVLGAGGNESYTICKDVNQQENCGEYEISIQGGFQIVWGSESGIFDYTKSTYKLNPEDNFGTRDYYGFSFIDMNGDNLYDIVGVGRYGENGSKGLIDIHLNGGDRTFNQYVKSNTWEMLNERPDRNNPESFISVIYQFQTIDLDQDGDLDLRPSFAFQAGSYRNFKEGNIKAVMGGGLFFENNGSSFDLIVELLKLD